jgi:hypothetical protein
MMNRMKRSGCGRAGYCARLMSACNSRLSLARMFASFIVFSPRLELHVSAYDGGLGPTFVEQIVSTDTRLRHALHPPGGPISPRTFDLRAVGMPDADAKNGDGQPAKRRCATFGMPAAHKKMSSEEVNLQRRDDIASHRASDLVIRSAIFNFVLAEAGSDREGIVEHKCLVLRSTQSCNFLVRFEGG